MPARYKISYYTISSFTAIYWQKSRYDRTYISTQQLFYAIPKQIVHIVNLRDIIRETQTMNLYVVPSSIALAKFEAAMAGEIDSHFRLKDCIAQVHDDFENIIIDTPPTLGLLTVNAIVASSHILIPIQSSYFALEGTDDLLETIDKIKKRMNPNLQLLGAVVTLYDTRTILSRDIHSEIKNVFGHVAVHPAGRT